MEAALCFALLIVMMLIGVPIAFSFAAMTFALAMCYGIDMSTIITTGFWSINSIILLALPLFIMAGYIMERGGIAGSLVTFVNAYVGRIRGGLGSSMVVSSAIFGAISGSSSGAIASIGTIMIPPMEAKGYPRAYSSALCSASSVLGLLIPPSLTMIHFAVVTRQSVAACFLSTLIPGLLLAFLYIVINTVMAKRMNLAVEPPLPFKESLRKKSRATRKALPALMLPVIILGGIYGGFFTPTEAAAVAFVYAVPVGFLIYKELTLKVYCRAMVEAAATTGSVVIILIFSFAASRIMTLEAIPQQLAEVLLDAFHDKYVILLVVNLLLIFLGMLIDDMSVTAIMSPMLLPAMMEIGVHPIHFAALVGANTIIGFNSPPVAFGLYVACRIGKVGMHEIIRPIMVFLIFACIPVMLATTYFEPLSLWLPTLLGYVK
ncbi:MAG: TRAP transporter large permease subunit [Candidatus Adiutrix sp.]|jgi:tripartite ATP-independent transporter DctM subunit|nr:TRAP transporter large permease subunit [Candidatus Adiutrix sp.]